MNDNRITVAYVRLSQEDYDKQSELSSSIYNQLGFIKSYAKSMGLVIDKEYIDDGYTGMNYDRPGFEKLKDDIDQGIIGVVITKDMSRLGRELVETLYYISEYFPKNNIRYIAINDQFDSNNPDDDEQQILLSFRAILNNKYAKDASIKRKQVADSKTEEGQFIGFIAPYGYKIIKDAKDKKTLEVDEYAANIVKKIFTEIASGKTRKEVAKELNNEKVMPPVIYMKMTPSKNKKYYYDWSDKVIYRILKNKTYLGKLVKRKSLSKNSYKKKRKVISIRDRETINNCHPAIITEDLFEAANSRLKTTKAREKNDYSGLFSGLVLCGECGRVMSAIRVRKENGNIKYHFECTRVVDRKVCVNRTIADSKLKAIVTDTLKDIMNVYIDDDDIAKKVTRDLLKSERPNLKISNLKADIELHNKNIRNLYLSKASGEVSLDEFITKKNLETSLKEQSEQLLKRIIESKNEEIRREELLKKYNEFMHNGVFVNDTIRDLIDKIVVYKDNTIKISFKFGLGQPKKIKLF